MASSNLALSLLFHRGSVKFCVCVEIAFPSRYVLRLRALEEKFYDHDDHHAGNDDDSVKALPLPFTVCCITG